ncbi:hypothetical protein D3C71_234410 [compost metagenome]
MNTGDFDQMFEAIKDIAKVTKATYDAHKAAGFNHQDSMFIALELTKTLFKPDGK